MSKIVQFGRFLFGLPDIFDSSIKEIVSTTNSIKNSFANELKAEDTK